MQKRSIGAQASYWLILPAFLLYTGFVIVPALSSIYYSLTSWDGISPVMKYIGLRNYLDMFHSPRFFNALRNTWILTVSITILENVTALALAILVDKIRALKSFFRSIFYLPVLLSGIVAGYIWSTMFNYSFGIVNQFLTAVHLNILKLDWLGHPKIALFSIVITMVWKAAGYFMIIYLAGLQGIPQEMSEAARIDGANSIEHFRYITFPMLAGAVTINLTLSLISGLRIFDQIVVMTDGGPGFATETLTYLIFKVAFADLQQGYGTALAMVLFAMILVFGTIQVRLLRRREVEL